jgi:predicted RNA-binding Zn ribbon-like protein
MSARPAPFFVGEHPAIDLLNTVATPAGTTFDWLTDGADLIAWLEQAALIDPATASEFRKRNPRELDGLAKEARALREGLRQFVKRHAGKPLKPGALKELEGVNELLARDHIYFQIEPRSASTSVARSSSTQPSSTQAPSFEINPRRRWTRSEQLLQPLAFAIGDLVSSADFRLVRGCESPECTVFFYDRTKNHRRRWCSMALCGNRAKVAAFRDRQS